jgi:hypothetical protein
MEFLMVQCWSCEARFDTASERSTHHLDAHERLTRRDGTLLVPPRSLTEPGGGNGRWHQGRWRPARRRPHDHHNRVHL